MLFEYSEAVEQGLPWQVTPIRYNHWATRQVLKACAELDESLWTAQVEVGWGSLRQSSLHIISAEVCWSERLKGLTPTFALEDAQELLPPHQLLTIHETAAIDFETSAIAALRQDPTRKVTYRQGSDLRAVSAMTIVTHVIAHGVHHWA